MNGICGKPSEGLKKRFPFVFLDFRFILTADASEPDNKQYLELVVAPGRYLFRFADRASTLSQKTIAT
jgi:hypothetical protein